MTHPIRVVIDLSVAIMSVEPGFATILAVGFEDAARLPSGRFDPEGHPTLEIGLRDWVQQQTGFDLGHVEQLYTFGDRGRGMSDGAKVRESIRHISISYLGLTPDQSAVGEVDARWQDWYHHFPWEDHRRSRPEVIDARIAPELLRWASGDVVRHERVGTAFGLAGRPWVEENTLERYELLYEAGLVAEAGGCWSGLGGAMILDHRRILATAIGRLRGKIKYRPIMFKLLPETFTLSDLQKRVEVIVGVDLHTQNFRRALGRTGLIERVAGSTHETGGRPAALYRYVGADASRDIRSGVQTPTRRSRV